MKTGEVTERPAGTAGPFKVRDRFNLREELKRANCHLDCDKRNDVHEHNYVRSVLRLLDIQTDA